MRYWDQVGPQNKRVNIATVPNFAFCDYEPHGLYGFTTRGAPHCTDCKLFSLSLSLSLSTKPLKWQPSSPTVLWGVSAV